MIPGTPDSGTHEFAVLESKILLESPILAVRRDRLAMPGGTAADREIIEHFGAVAVVAVNEAGEVAMVRQYRHSVQERLWELPAGLLDMAGESELATAQRELVEEAGLTAQRWSVLVDMVTSPGFCEETVRVFLAQDLSEVSRPAAEDEEADMTLAWVDLAEARSAIMSGDIINSIAIAGIFAANEVLAGRAEARPVSDKFRIRPRHMAERREQQGIGPDLKRI